MENRESVKDRIARVGVKEALRLARMESLMYWLDCSRDHTMHVMLWLGRSPENVGYHAKEAAHNANIAQAWAEEMLNS